MDKKSREIFYGVVLVATLIVAIIGTSLAYFTYFASSDDNAIKAHAGALVDIEYNDGEQVTAQADKLIPSSLDVVKKVYEKNIAITGVDSPTSNACIDSEGRQVCSVYRFSVASDIECEAYALLKNEKNEFTYLAYAVKDVTNNTWLKMNSNNNDSEQFIKIPKNNTEKESIFGYKNNKPQSQIISTEPHTYDLVLFIYENNQAQNSDQGKNYLGTISIEVTNDISAIISQ